MDAKEFLKQLQKLDKMIENKSIEKEQWKSIALGITSSSKTIIIKGVQHAMDKVQAQGEQQKMADAVARYVDIEHEIALIIDKLIDARKDVISVIEQLPAVEYDLLHKVYVQCFTLDEYAARCGNSYSWATTIHGRALKEVQRILDERQFGDGNGAVYA